MNKLALLWSVFAVEDLTEGIMLLDLVIDFKYLSIWLLSEMTFQNSVKLLLNLFWKDDACICNKEF